MVRSAGMYFTSEAVKYLPSVDEVVQFQPLVSGGSSSSGSSSTDKKKNQEGSSSSSNSGTAEAREEGAATATLSPETVRAATNLDQVRRE